MNILEAMDDTELFARWFRDVGTWQAWRAFLAALFGLPMPDDHLLLFQECTGRSEAPPVPAQEGWLIIGRRGGKSFVMALIAVFLACFREYRDYLAPGERASILVLAADRKQARVIIRYIRAMLTEIPMLAGLIERETTELFDLKNRVTIEVATASFRTTRGYALAAAICDEIAFWPSDDAAEPDYEIIDAIRPALATLPGAMLLCASSPYARKGALFDAFRRQYGPEGDPSILVWKAPTRTMNPTVRQQVVDDAMERDHQSASSEWLAEFRNDLAAFVDRDTVLACVEPDVRERQAARQLNYVGFVDPSGGSSDSMTLAVAHREKDREGDRIVVDLLREVMPPFSPARTCWEFAVALEPYRVKRIFGDRYAGEWAREPFRKRGVTYDPAVKPKADLYVNLLPLLNAGSIVLPDNPRLINQLASLERRVTRGGRDSIDHPPAAHDDLANVVAGVAWAAQGAGQRGAFSQGTVMGLY